MLYRVVRSQPAGNAVGASVSEPKRILVFRPGQLGDTLVSLPAMWAVRERFPRAHMALLCDIQKDKGYVVAADILRGSGIFDAYLTYVFADSPAGRLFRPYRALRLLLALRRCRLDTLVYLAPSSRTPEQVTRDRLFFRAAGVRRFMGMDGFPTAATKPSDGALPESPREADLLLERVSRSGIPVPPPGQGRLDIGLGPRETAEVERWLRPLPPDGGRPWVAVGPGSKMSVKVWPEERFQRAVEELIRDRDVWPVVFGSREDRGLGERLLAAWGRGYDAAGFLDVRVAAAALSRCVLYVGNDTGTMHLAAAVGVPCVAIFSSRAAPGQWYPYGGAHRVLRTAIECEGCGLVECVEYGKRCILRVGVDQVVCACRAVLAERGAGD